MEVNQDIADSIRELCTRYAIDGTSFLMITFYPTAAQDFDADGYTASSSTISLADWRRQNVNDLMRGLLRRRPGVQCAVWGFTTGAH